MADRVDSPLAGFGIIPDRMIFDNITAQGDPAVVLTASEFTQAGSRPGQATADDIRSRLEPQISNAQTNAVELRGVRGGHPVRRLRNGSELAYRLVSENTDEYAWRGWSPPNLLNHWVGAVWSDADEYEVHDLTVTTDDQQLILVYMQTDAGVEPLRSRTFDFTTGAWGAEVTVSVDPHDATPPENVNNDGVTCVALPDGRVLAIAEGLSPSSVAVWASDDTGATWFRHSDTDSTGLWTGSVTRLRSCEFRGTVLLMVGSTGGRITQLVSTSSGTTWETTVDEDAVGTSHSIVPLPERAGVVLSYIRDGDSFPCVRILSTATDPFDNLTETVVESLALDDLTCAVDGVGNIWLIGRETNTDQVRVWLSADPGHTIWDRLDGGGAIGQLFNNGDVSTYPRNFSSVFCRGWCVTAHNWTATPGNEDGSIGTIWSGGWGSFASASPSLTEPGHVERRSFEGHTGIPIEMPQDTVWALAGTAPALVSPGWLEWVLAAAAGSVSINPGTADPGFFFEGQIVSGTGSSTALQYGFGIVGDNGVSTNQVQVRFDNANSRIRVFDVQAAATIGDISVDVSSPVQVIGFMQGDDWFTLWRRPFETRWRRGPETTSLGAGATGPGNSITFGSPTAATITTHTRQWHFVDASLTSTQFSHGLPEPTTTGTGSQLHYGGEVTLSPRPIPEVGTETAAAFLSAQRGPGYIGETFEILPTYDFGIERTDPRRSPSPSQEFWRTTGTADEMTVCYDLGILSNLGSIWHWLFGFLNVNVKTIIVERSVSGASWLATGTYNGAEGFETLGFSRTGDWVRPAAGSSAGARFLNRNEAAGGMMILDVGGTPVARRIIEHSPGHWDDPTVAAAMRPEFRLEDVDDGADPSSGDCDIVFPSGVLSVPISGASPTAYARYWRFRIPVQDTWDTAYQVGKFVPASASVVGKRWSNGGGRDATANVSRRQSRAGVIRKRQRGPVRREWSMNWADGVVQGFMERGTTEPPFLSTAPGGFPPLAAKDDVWTVLWALLEETGGTEVPVLAMSLIPSTSKTENDRRRFLFGTWDSSVQVSQVTGRSDVFDEGAVPTFARIAPITITEEP